MAALRLGVLGNVEKVVVEKGYVKIRKVAERKSGTLATP